jgi:hypothetical protein
MHSFQSSEFDGIVAMHTKRDEKPMAKLESTTKAAWSQKHYALSMKNTVVEK